MVRVKTGIPAISRTLPSLKVNVGNAIKIWGAEGDGGRVP